MKVALITGGSRGIGAAIAKRFAEENIQLALIDTDISGLRELSQRLESAYKIKVIYFGVDVADSVGVGLVVEDVKSKFGGLDILVNNAGIASDGLVFRLSDEDWQRVLSVNLTGAFNLIRACAKVMIKRRYGRIINISSVVGLVGNIGQANYAASKAGLIGLTKSVAKELAGFGITVNAICPGYIQTQMTQNLKENIQRRILDEIPLGRFGRVEEVAELVNFLASDKAAYITGEVIVIDGGLFM